MQSPQVIYATPGGVLTPRARPAALLAMVEKMRVTLPAPLPSSEARGR